DVTDPAKGRELRVLRGHKDCVNRLVLLTNNTTLVSGSDDGSVRFWNLSAKPRDRKQTTVPVTLGLWWVSPDSKSIFGFEESMGAAGRVSPNRLVRFSQESDFQEMEVFCNFGTNTVDWAWSSGDSRLLAISVEGGDVEVWDLQRRTRTCKFTAQS